MRRRLAVIICPTFAAKLGGALHWIDGSPLYIGAEGAYSEDAFTRSVTVSGESGTCPINHNNVLDGVKPC